MELKRSMAEVMISCLVFFTMVLAACQGIQTTVAPQDLNSLIQGGPHRLLAYSDQKIIFDKETMLKKGSAEVQSYLQTSDGKKIPLFYRLTNKSGSWKVYDVIIEGVSMVKNYRTQFRDILAKGSPEKLLEILREKVGN